MRKTPYTNTVKIEKTKVPYSFSKETLILKRFIRSFNFPYPIWNNLPNGFPNCDTNELEKEEKHLFGAIQLAWITSAGQPVFYKNLAKRGLIIVVIFLSLLMGINNLTNPKNSILKAVNAATISATLKQSQIQAQDILESTASALFKSAH